MSETTAADSHRDKANYERGWDTALKTAAEAVYEALGRRADSDGAPSWQAVLAMVRATAFPGQNPEPEIGGRVSRLENQFGYVLNRLEAVERGPAVPPGPCPGKFDDTYCELLAGHAGLHMSGNRVWDDVPLGGQSAAGVGGAQ